MLVVSGAGGGVRGGSCHDRLLNKSGFGQLSHLLLHRLVHECRNINEEEEGNWGHAKEGSKELG